MIINTHVDAMMARHEPISYPTLEVATLETPAKIINTTRPTPNGTPKEVVVHPKDPWIIVTEPLIVLHETR